jgi:hypothetical protein
MGFVLVLIFSVTAFSQGKNYQSQTAEVNGVKIHCIEASAMSQRTPPCSVPIGLACASVA